MGDSIVVQTSEDLPVVFTQDELGWLPWLDPLPEAELTERHFSVLVDKARAKSDYFRLLVRDPEVLEARTKTDKDIFYNAADGLPRAERDVCGHRPREEVGHLHDHAEAAPQFSRSDSAIVLPVEEDGTRCRLVKTVEQPQE